MNILRSVNHPWGYSSSSSTEEDFLIRQIVLTHDPDGRHLDSELMLRALENIMSYAAITQVSDQHASASAKSDLSSIKTVGSEESLGHTIHKLSSEILCNCSVGGNTHAKTMTLFDMLRNYRWDAKAVLVLSAFSTSYGEFWLVMKLYPSNPLAASIALLKQFPNDLSLLKARFKALTMLVKTIIDVTKCIIKFEGLPMRCVLIDDEAIVASKSQIYMATYWVIRSALICSSHIRDLIAMKNVQVHSNTETIASWELSSLVCRLSTISTRLRHQVDIFYQLIETKMHYKLLNLFKENRTDNQEVLEMLFALKDDLPLKDCSSQAKLGVSELKNNVVMLLITRAELLPIEVLLLLVQQIFDRAKLDRSYEIVWVPIASSDTWTCAEEESFDFLSNSLPWFSIRQPWLLSSIVVKFIKQEWNFNEDPLMVVLDKQGMVTNSNAVDMTLIWGARAYPFSISRENELWEEQTWNLQLLIDGIDPKVAKWVEEDQNICIYGGDDLDWLREFTAKMREIVSSGLQLKMVYVGKKNPSENIRKTLRVMGEEKLTGSLTLMKINFFWLRLESMRRSKFRLGHTDDKDQILKQLSGLLDTNESEKGWVIMGRGCSTDIVSLQGREVMECLDLLPVWGEKVTMLGLVGAIRTAIEPALLAEPCHHSNIVPFVEGLKDTLFCEKCKRPVEKFVVYKCDGTEYGDPSDVARPLSLLTMKHL
ncbi:protein SIEVE ELEMENT OCCLUSION C isoform X2 [Actinidia eriantha]|uniref:protein SIEVE ELEMENT OCCLUSION C isoform X2 n=1 Tax=Actinidia eriantha TaxID=165200 RepID=UPI00258D714C|nr:protein SIEVE ELEMENT OCCLUSION C isoform X2 [Actinidia eriantha]